MSAVLFPLYGRFNTRYGTKRLLLVNVLGISVSVVCFSFVTSLWQIYLVSAAYGLFYNGPGFLIISLLISEWFSQRRGLAIGIASAGSGLGGALLVPLTNKVISAFGWRAGYVFIGVLLAVVVIPIVLLLIENKPRDVGLVPLGESTGAVLTEKFGPTLKQAMHGPVFWLLLASMMLMSFIAASANSHMNPYLTDLGYTSEYAASTFSVMMLSVVVGKVSLGFIYDRFGSIAGNLCVGVAGIAGAAFAVAAARPWAPFWFAVFCGLAVSGISTTGAILAGKYFGNRSYTSICSIISMIISLGNAVCVPALGAVFDITGSYLLGLEGYLCMRSGHVGNVRGGGHRHHQAAPQNRPACTSGFRVIIVKEKQ